MATEKKDDLLYALEMNYKGYFELGEGLPGYSCRQLSTGTTYVDSGWYDTFFNVILKSAVTQSNSLAETEGVLDHFLSTGRPFRWKVHSQQDRLRTFLTGQGLAITETAYAFSMPTLDGFTCKQLGYEKRLRLVEISDTTTRLLWWKAFSSAFDVKPDLRDAICEFNDRATRNTPEGGFKNIVFLEEGMPICSATLFDHAGVLSLYDLGVVPSRRREGYGRAAMLQLSELAQRTLHANIAFYSTSAGRFLYKSLGCVEHGSFNFYGLP